MAAVGPVAAEPYRIVREKATGMLRVGARETFSPTGDAISFACSPTVAAPGGDGHADPATAPGPPKADNTSLRRIRAVLEKPA